MNRERWNKIPEHERKHRLAERFEGMATLAERQGRVRDANGYRATAVQCRVDAARRKSGG